jgi:hypothetical protein
LEEENFSEAALNAVMTLEEQQAISAAAGKHSQENSQPAHWIVPFLLFNLEHEDRASMAASIPPVVVNELVMKAWIDHWSPMKPFLLE